MNGIPFIRKIDDLGRIVIPKELRGKLKLSENENILLKLTDNKIEIQKTIEKKSIKPILVF